MNLTTTHVRQGKVGLYPLGGTGTFAPECTRGGDQSEEGQEDIPRTGTNQRTDRRIYPGRGPIGGGTGG
eukprot:605041-Prorocentrum_minimum.AAC.1